MGNLLFGRKATSKPQATIAPVERAGTTVYTAQILPIHDPGIPKVVHILMHVRTRAQLQPSATIDGPQFTLSIHTVGAGDSKIDYLKVLNRNLFCEVAQMYYCVNGTQRQFVYTFSLGKFPSQKMARTELFTPFSQVAAKNACCSFTIAVKLTFLQRFLLRSISKAMDSCCWRHKSLK
jgi:hypothetical protein